MAGWLWRSAAGLAELSVPFRFFQLLPASSSSLSFLSCCFLVAGVCLEVVVGVVGWRGCSTGVLGPNAKPLVKVPWTGVCFVAPHLPLLFCLFGGVYKCGFLLMWKKVG